MTREIKVFSHLPQEAKEIREQVFILEQGFQKEYDQIDEIATHFVLYQDGEAIGTCRVFLRKAPFEFMMGRLAVKKEWRGRGLGAQLLAGAERWAKESGGQCLVLHAQLQAKEFYEKVGYTAYGDVEYEEDCPHIWMKKELK